MPTKNQEEHAKRVLVGNAHPTAFFERQLRENSPHTFTPGETTLLIGPVFNREATIAPRRPRLYIARAGYPLALLILMWTAWLVLTGTQTVRDTGDLARFGSFVFQLLSLFQLALALFFSAMFSASAVAQEKDRRTLILLLLTNLSNSELVLGKLLASVLSVLVMLAAALPVFMFSAVLGGISFGQIAQVFAITLISVLACASLGSTLALWREKTFQALATTVLALVLWLAVWEIVAAGWPWAQWSGISSQTWAAVFSPWQAVLEASRPHAEPAPFGPFGSPVYAFLFVASLIAILLNGIAMAMVRIWNPSREARSIQPAEATRRPESIFQAEHDTSSDALVAKETAPPASPPASPARSRRVWDNPVLWREIRTWAYGRKLLAMRATYLMLFGLATFGLHTMLRSGQPIGTADGAMVLVPLFLLGLVLVNAQAVTSLTSERDGRALDLLLVTDLTPKEIVFGKLGGVFYNTKEIVVLPTLLCLYMFVGGAIHLENLILLVVGLIVMYGFVAMLGIHIGMNYASSRSAIATSLGTVFFLFVGVATCIRIMVAFSGAFEAQLPTFAGLMIGGGVGMYVALGARNPSPAIGLASFVCPLATFYAIASFLLGSMLAVFLVTVFAYGFATAAMLIPAIYEFDVAMGKATVEER